jgi:O-methyltransferase involved in polyketide biosynthesis
VSSIAVKLERVPETLLWTLHHRAVEVRRPDTVLRDPMAVKLVERIHTPRWQDALTAMATVGAARAFRVRA